MRPQLRECPCCGGTARRIRSKQYFIIQCGQCSLRATGTGWTDVEERWNLRATDAALEVLRVKLRELNVKLDRLEGRSQ